MSVEQNHKARLVLNKVIRTLNESGKLNFEYTNNSGEADVTNQMFNVLFSDLDVFKHSKQFSKIQTVNNKNAVFLVSYVLKNYHCEDFQIYVPQNLKQFYEIFEEVKLNVHYFEDIHSVKYGQGDFVILDQHQVENFLDQKTIEDLNHKQVCVLVSVDSIPLKENQKQSIKTLSDYFKIGLNPILSKLSKLNSFCLNLDTGSICAFEGLNTGHMYFRFQDAENEAEDFEATFAKIARLTVSTLTKLGADILRVLLSDEKLSGEFIKELIH